jgi:hypothetical protein
MHPMLENWIINFRVLRIVWHHSRPVRAVDLDVRIRLGSHTRRHCCHCLIRADVSGRDATGDILVRYAALSSLPSPAWPPFMPIAYGQHRFHGRQRLGVPGRSWAAGSAVGTGGILGVPDRWRPRTLHIRIHEMRGHRWQFVCCCGSGYKAESGSGIETLRRA